MCWSFMEAFCAITVSVAINFNDAQYILNSEGIPRCSCGGMIKPDVVLYEEGLDSDTLNRAVRAIAEADVLIIGGNIACGLSGGRADRITTADIS